MTAFFEKSYQNIRTRKRQIPTGICRFQPNPTFWVGKKLLRNVKFSLRSGKIAVAAGGFHLTFRVIESLVKGESL